MYCTYKIYQTDLFFIDEIETKLQNRGLFRRDFLGAVEFLGKDGENQNVGLSEDSPGHDSKRGRSRERASTLIFPGPLLIFGLSGRRPKNEAAEKFFDHNYIRVPLIPRDPKMGLVFGRRRESIFFSVELKI